MRRRSAAPSIVLVPHDPAWAADFDAEASRLRRALGASLVAIHHIGSTAVAGIVAKPVLDLLAVVTSLDTLDATPVLTDALGYEAMGAYGIPGRRYFRKSDAAGVRTHHLHAFAPGDPAIARHLRFRDHLRRHPADAQAYDQLKRRLAKQFGDRHAAYTDGKSAFILDVLARAGGAGSPAATGAGRATDSGDA